MGLVVTDAMGNTIVVDVEAPTPPKPSPVASDSPAHMPPHKAARAHLSEISSYQPQAEDPPSTPRNSRDESVANQSQAIQYTADDKRKSRAPHGDNIIVPTTTDAKCAAAADAGESTELPLPCSTESVSPLELDKKEILSNVTAVGEAVKEQCTTTEILVPASSEHSPVSNASDTVDIVTPEVNVRPASGGEDSPVVSAKKNSVPTSPRGHGASNDTDARSDLAISTTDLPPEAQSHSTAMRKGRQSPGKLVIEPQNNAFNPPLTRQRSSNSKAGLHTNALIAYNQYGDIVKVKDMKEPQDPSKLTATETLRLINKVYGFEVSINCLIVG